MRRIFAQTRKELTQIVRDWRTLALALVLPVVLLLLMSTAISLTVNDLPIVVQDFDDSSASHDFIDSVRASITLHVVSWPVNKTAEEALASNVARAVMIIPVHFGRDMARGTNSPVQLLVDASDANTAKLVSGYANQIASAYNQQTAGGVEAGPVKAAIRLWYNPGLSSQKFYGSSIYAHEFLLGKIIAFMAVALAECLVMSSLLFTYFGLNFAGDPTTFLIATFLYAF